MNAHTPGPWTVHDRGPKKNPRCLVLAKESHGRIQIAGLWDGDDPYGRRLSSIADAHLIAAAPNLLAALKRVENSWRDIYTGPEDPRAVARFSDHTISIWREMLAAIAKAEGRS
jgi:hypothetical protein